MEKQIGQEYKSQEQRVRYLKDNCNKIEEKGYMKAFTTEDMQGYKENLANVSIEINGLELRKKSYTANIKDQLKPLIEERNEILENIEHKAKYVKELCYKFTDEEERTTGYYNSNGELIESRPATADELQPTIFSLKNGTHE